MSRSSALEEHYEKEIERNPLNFNTWWNYINSLYPEESISIKNFYNIDTVDFPYEDNKNKLQFSLAPNNVCTSSSSLAIKNQLIEENQLYYKRFSLYEKALKYFPSSYKLLHNYLLDLLTFFILKNCIIKERTVIEGYIEKNIEEIREFLPHYCKYNSIKEIFGDGKPSDSTSFNKRFINIFYLLPNNLIKKKNFDEKLKDLFYNIINNKKFFFLYNYLTIYTEFFYFFLLFSNTYYANFFFNIIITKFAIGQHEKIWKLYLYCLQDYNIKVKLENEDDEEVNEEEDQVTNTNYFQAKFYIPIEDGINIFLRSLCYNKKNFLIYIDYLIKKNQYKKIIQEIFNLLQNYDDIIKEEEELNREDGEDNENEESKEDKEKVSKNSFSFQSEYDLWLKLCEILSKNAKHFYDNDIKTSNNLETNKNSSNQISSFIIDKIFQYVIKKFSKNLNNFYFLWATYYLKNGNFLKVRDIYEEAIEKIQLLRDFIIIYDTYVKIEEKILLIKISEKEANDKIRQESNKTLSKQEQEEIDAENADISLRLARLEYLIAQRPLLVNRVIIRQNPNNIGSWMKRIKLLGQYDENSFNISENSKKTTSETSTSGESTGSTPSLPQLTSFQIQQILLTYIEACLVINPQHVVGGKLSSFFISWSKFIENYLKNPQLSYEILITGCHLGGFLPNNYKNLSHFNKTNNIFLLLLKNNNQNLIFSHNNLNSDSSLFASLSPHLFSSENNASSFSTFTSPGFKHIDELVTLICYLLEREIKNKKSLVSISNILKEIVFYKSSPNSPSPILEKLSKHATIWAFYLDIEEAIVMNNHKKKENQSAVVDLTPLEIAYDKGYELKTLTLKMILNYIEILKENNFFEKSFQVNEKFLNYFSNNNFLLKFFITKIYIKNFKLRYNKLKVERVRNIYDELIVSNDKSSLIDKKNSEKYVEIFLSYIQYEEELGNIRRVFNLFYRSFFYINKKYYLKFIKLWLKKIEFHYGLIKTREVFDLIFSSSSTQQDSNSPSINFLQILTSNELIELSLLYASMEINIFGEVERARKIFTFSSQFLLNSTPSSTSKNIEETFIQKWKEFEYSHGSEMSFKEMLRILRTIEMEKSSSMKLNKNMTDFFTEQKMKKSQPSSIEKVPDNEDNKRNLENEQEGDEENSSKKIKLVENKEEIDIDI